jgi:cytochrome c-type biogenesis protein CcmH/NrfF
MNPETINVLAPLWNIVIAIVVITALVVWAELRQRKDDDVQHLIDERRARAHDRAGRDT